MIIKFSFLVFGIFDDALRLKFLSCNIRISRLVRFCCNRFV